MKIIITENQLERIVKSVLNEGRVIDSIYQKKYSEIDRALFNKIITADPKTKLDKDIIGPAGQWLLKIYKDKSMRLEDLAKATEYLNIYYRFKLKNNLQQLKSLGDLYEIVKEYMPKAATTLSTVLNILPKNEYEVAYDGENWVVYIPKTQKAAGWLGVNTQWCTAWGEYSLNKDYKDRHCHFSRHNNQGPLYIIINKNNENDKFQLHFETEQLKDKSDNNVNIETFWGDKKEVLYYFYPSLIEDVSEQQAIAQLSRLKFLPKSIVIKLIDDISLTIDNPLIVALLTKDKEAVNELISGAKDITIYSNHDEIEFELQKFTRNINYLGEVIGYYSYESSSNSDRVYYDVREYLDDSEYYEKVLEEYFKNYYENNKNKINQNFRIKNYEHFKFVFFELFYKNEKIKEAFISSTIELSSEEYQNLNSAEVERIGRYLGIETGFTSKTVSLSISYFISFLADKDIKKIEATELYGILDDYIFYYDLPVDYEPVNYQIKFPKYNDDKSNRDIKDETDNFFDDAYDNNECVELQQKYNNIISKYFKNSDTYENDLLKITLKNKFVDCETKTIRITYLNKKTNEIFGEDGNDAIQIDNLAPLITNLKLF